MTNKDTWWDELVPWLDAVCVSAAGIEWSGFQPEEGRIDLQDHEGPISLRSVSGGSGPYFRRTLAGCDEYLLDLALVNDLIPHTACWSLHAPVLRAHEPHSFPRPGVLLPLEAQWEVEWKAMAGPLVRTSGESGRGTEAGFIDNDGQGKEVWEIRRRGLQLLFLACHEPAEKPWVKSTSALIQNGRYTVRVTGDGFFDYWMLDPEHVPAPLAFDDCKIEVGVGWGYVRLEHGRETTHGALRQDWGFT